MPHDNDHSHCHDESHEHDHPAESGVADNLYSYIDISNVTALNVTDDHPGRAVIKPWGERLDETVWISSDADEQIIIRIPFTGSVRLRSVLLKCGPGDETPAKLCLFANENNLDFSDIADKIPDQEFPVPQSREVGEYAVKASKFSNLSSLTLFFPEAQGADNTKLYFIGLRGTWSERKRDPVITVYESQANLADHEKIQGFDGGVNARLGS